MIRDVTELEGGATLHAEVCIVGAGFAGIDLARCLGRQGVHVVLLESGRMEFDPATQALARVRSVGKPCGFPTPTAASPHIWRRSSEARPASASSAARRASGPASGGGSMR